MVKRKCPACASKIDRKFNFCPYCGVSFKAKRERENFGMLGRGDIDEIQDEVKLPFGMNKIVGSLVKQLEKQMNELNGENGVPRGIKIRVARNNPQGNQVVQRSPVKKIDVVEVSNEENRRRMGLPKVEVESKVRRLADRIVYEIETPGVKAKTDVVVTELASGLEIKAYSKDKCYVKFIPLKVEIIEYYVEKEKVFLEIEG